MLYLFVEGDDDERLISHIISKIYPECINLRTVKYSQLTDVKVDSFLQSIISMPNSDYLFFCDQDESLCITKKKLEIKKRYPHVEDRKIIVVKKEIESWYFAGFSNKPNQRRSLRIPQSTQELSKEKFNTLVKPIFQSPLEAKLAILEVFDIDQASLHNNSLAYFIHRLSVLKKII